MWWRMTNFSCLATGSSGNCYLINLGGGCIILDAGITIKKILDNVNLNDVQFACISHSHNDHKATMPDLLRKRVQVFYGGSNEKVKISHCKGHKITQVPIHHGECINNAFIIQYNSECVLYATDFTLCEYDLSEFRFTRVIVECNFCEDLIPNEMDLKTKRQINTHMSLNGLKVFLDKINLTGCEEIDLIHKSNQYGNAVVMGATIYARYKIPTGVCKQFGGVAYYGRK